MKGGEGGGGGGDIANKREEKIPLRRARCSAEARRRMKRRGWEERTSHRERAAGVAQRQKWRQVERGRKQKEIEKRGRARTEEDR